MEARNVKLGAQDLDFKGVDLGATEGGLTISIKGKETPIKADQLGEIPLDIYYQPAGVTIKTTLVEAKKKSNWLVAFPFAKQVIQGEKSAIHFDTSAGFLSERAGLLNFRPTGCDPADYSENFRYFKAVVTKVGDIKLNPDKQSGLEIEFTIMPDTTVSPPKVFIYGDPTIGLVAAALAKTAQAGTGNGTVSNIAAGIKAVTEVIVATCIAKVAGAGIFEVVGTESGLIGNARVGVLLDSPAAVFKIVAGTIDFEVGDTITFGSTAANYA